MARSMPPTIPAQARTSPKAPLADMAATPLTYSTSPTDFIASGPSARYIAWASMKTLADLAAHASVQHAPVVIGKRIIGSPSMLIDVLRLHHMRCKVLE